MFGDRRVCLICHYVFANAVTTALKPTVVCDRSNRRLDSYHVTTVFAALVPAVFFKPPLPLPPPHLSESVEYLSLELITLSVRSVEAETVRGVRVTVSGTCQVKVDAFTQGNLSQNVPQITLACQHFLGKVSPTGEGNNSSVFRQHNSIIVPCC